jgi:hypothetical protein
MPNIILAGDYGNTDLPPAIRRGPQAGKRWYLRVANGPACASMIATGTP